MTDIERRFAKIEHDIIRLTEESATHYSEIQAINADAATLALQRQIDRLAERIKALEKKLG